MNNAVLDTNIIVSALLSPNGVCAKIMNMVFNGEMQIIYSEGILNEYKDVLFRASLDLSIERRKQFFYVLYETGTLIEPSVSDIEFLDESDRIFYDAARESNSALITFNTKHYPRDPFIMTPVELIRRK
jgi:putative PIN family toxin of toxin-antitoxin system